MYKAAQSGIIPQGFIIFKVQTLLLKFHRHCEPLCLIPLVVGFKLDLRSFFQLIIPEISGSLFIFLSFHLFICPSTSERAN